jgi:K+-transporting ATPase KdpF subunit
MTTVTWIALALTLFLFVYLFVALFQPELFD